MKIVWEVGYIIKSEVFSPRNPAFYFQVHNLRLILSQTVPKRDRMNEKC